MGPTNMPSSSPPPTTHHLKLWLWWPKLNWKGFLGLNVDFVLNVFLNLFFFPSRTAGLTWQAPPGPPSQAHWQRASRSFTCTPLGLNFEPVLAGSGFLLDSGSESRFKNWTWQVYMDSDPTNNQTQQLYMDLDQALEVNLAGLYRVHILGLGL
jgi:hypothetical protein